MIWFDLDNSPHVPLFRPILAQLRERGEATFVTSRRHAQTEELLQMWGIDHICVGAHGGKGKTRKILNLLRRAQQLRRAVSGKEVTLAVSHGSRTQMVAAASMRLRTLVMDDYEYSEQNLARFFADHVLVPEYIPEDRLKAAGFRLDRILRYTGFKEEVYLADFVPDPRFRQGLGISEDALLVTLRPPSVAANYHDARSEGLFRECLERLAGFPSCLSLIVNRTEAERRLVPDALLRGGAVRFLEKPVDGLQLLWASDLVVSGGGTMNREAALLGVPAISVFSGRRPAMDERLVAMGRLRFIERSSDIRNIPLVRRDRTQRYEPAQAGLASRITDVIMELDRRGH